MKCTFDIMDCKIQILGDQGCIYVCNKNVFTQLNTKATWGKNSNVQYQCIEEIIDHERGHDRI